MKRVHWSCNWILAGLLALLGFSACSGNNEEDISAIDCPYKRLTLKGKVSNEAGNAVSGIKVKVTEFHTETNGTRYAIQADSVKTNASGNYEFSSNYETLYPFEVTFEDIDGEQNGLFKPDTIFISQDDLDKVQYIGGDGGWYQGSGEIIVNVTLKEQD